MRSDGGGPTASVQPPRARYTGFHQKSHDLAREAVGWNALLGRHAVTDCYRYLFQVVVSALK